MGAKDQLRIEISSEADRVVLSLVGELDMASAPMLQAAVESSALEPAPMVVLDLQQLQFIDSTGLRAILTVREHCRERGQRFAITRGTQQVQRLLSVTGMTEHLHTLTA